MLLNAGQAVFHLPMDGSMVEYVRSQTWANAFCMASGAMLRSHGAVGYGKALTTAGIPWSGIPTVNSVDVTTLNASTGVIAWASTVGVHVALTSTDGTMRCLTTLASGECDKVRVTALSTSKFLLAFENVTDGNIGQLRAIKATGITMLAGATVTFHDAFGGYSLPSLTPLASNMAALMYRDDADSGRGKCVLVSASGVDPGITVGLGMVSTIGNGLPVDVPSICSLSSTSLVAAYCDDLNNGVARSQVGSVVGSGIIWYDPVTVSAEPETSNLSIAPLGTTVDGKPRVVFTYTYPSRIQGHYEDGVIPSGSTYYTMPRTIGGNAVSRIATINTDTMTFGLESDVNVVQGALNQPQTIGVDDTRAAVIYRDLTNGNRAAISYGVLCPTSNVMAWTPPSAVLSPSCYSPRIAAFSPNALLTAQTSGTSMVLGAVSAPDRFTATGGTGYTQASGLLKFSVFYRGKRCCADGASLTLSRGISVSVRSSGLFVSDALGTVAWLTSQVTDRIALGSNGDWHSHYWHVERESGSWRMWSSLDGSIVRDEGLGSGSGFVGTGADTPPAMTFNGSDADASYDEVTWWFSANRWTNHQASKVEMLRASGWLLPTYTDHVQSRVSGALSLSIYGPNPCTSGIHLFLKASDMFDDPHVVFYHPIDGHKEWTKHQAWDHRYRSVPGRVGSGMTTVVNDSVVLHTGIGADSGTAYHPRCGVVGVSQQRSIHSFVNNLNGYVYYWGCQVSGTTIASGSRLGCPSMFTWVDMDMIPAGDNAALSFRARNVSPYQLVADLVWFGGDGLGLSISSGTPVHTARGYYARGCVLSQSGIVTRAAVFWIANTGSLNLGAIYGRVITVSGTTITSMGPLSVDLNADRPLAAYGTAITQLQRPLVFNQNRVMISWLWDTIYSKMICIADDGTITPSGEFFGTGSPDNATSVNVAKLSDTKWACVEQGSWGAMSCLVESSGTSLHAHPAFKLPGVPQVGGAILSQTKSFSSSAIGISPSSYLMAANANVSPYSGAIWIMNQSGVYFVSGSITPFTDPGERIERCCLTKLTDQTTTASGTSLLLYRNTSDYHGKCRVIAFSGTTVHVGSEFKFNAANTRLMATCRMTDTRLGLIYLDNSDLISRLCCVTVSGLALEFGSQTTFAQHTAQDAMADFPIERVSDTRIAFATCLWTSGVNKYWRVNTAALSGATFIVGPALTGFTDTSVQYGNVGLTQIDDNRLMIGFLALSGATLPPYGRTYLLGVSGTTPTVLSSGTFTPGSRRSAGSAFGNSPRIEKFGTSGYMLSWLDESPAQYTYQSQAAMMRIGHIGADNTMVNGDYIYPPPREVGWSDHGFMPMRLTDNLGALLWRTFYGSIGIGGGVNVVAVRLDDDMLVFSKLTSLQPIGQRQLDAAPLNPFEILHYEQYDGTYFNGRWVIVKLLDPDFVGKCCWTQNMSGTEVWSSGNATIGVSGQTPGQGSVTLSPGLDVSSEMIWFRYMQGGITNAEYVSFASVTSSGLALATAPSEYPSCSGARHALLTFWARKPFDAMTVNVERGWNITLGDHRIMLSP